MFLRNRLNPEEAPAAGAPAPNAPAANVAAPPKPAPAPPPAQRVDPHRELRAKVHRALVENMRNSGLDDQSAPDAVRAAIVQELDRKLTSGDLLVSRTDRDRLVDEIYHDTLGLGPLEPLLADDDVSEIMVNGARKAFVERSGRLERIDAGFSDDQHLLRVIDRIVSKIGRRIDEASPMCDARLLDGSRVNAIIPPLAIDGPVLTIRKFRKDPLKVADLVRYGAMTQAVADFLQGCVEAKLNILVSGGTGTGKTTLLNVLSAFIPDGERLITIEDAAELQLQQDHVIRLETRPANQEGVGGISQSELLKNTLRMRPDRIILGEVRGPEALTMLQAMNTGHEGSLATIHSNNARDALARLETMVLMAGMDLPLRAIREQVASALDLIVQIERSADGARRLVSVTECVGMEGDILQLQEIFGFKREGVDADGRVVGRHVASGIRPKCAERLALRGIPLPVELFALEDAR